MSAAGKQPDLEIHRAGSLRRRPPRRPFSTGRPGGGLRPLAPPILARRARAGKPPIFPGASTLQLGLLTTPEQAGSSRLEFHQVKDEILLPLGFVDVDFVVPRVVVSNAQLERDRVRADVTSQDVDVDATLVLEIVSPSDTVLWSTTETLSLPQGRTVPIDRAIDPKLPPGDYRLRWELRGPGVFLLQGDDTVRVAQGGIPLEVWSYMVGGALAVAALALGWHARRRP